MKGGIYSLVWRMGSDPPVQIFCPRRRRTTCSLLRELVVGKIDHGLEEGKGNWFSLGKQADRALLAALWAHPPNC